MRLFARGCSSAHLPYAAVAGGLSPRERLDLEAHARTCAECADGLRDAMNLDIALRRSFAPLRDRRTSLAPGRVRVALGPRRDGARIARLLRMPSLFARLAEVSVALGVTMFAVGGTIEQPQTGAHDPPSVIQGYFRSQPPKSDIDYVRWLRLQPTPPDAPRQTAHLPVGGRFDVDQVEIVTNTTSPR